MTDIGVTLAVLSMLLLGRALHLNAKVRASVSPILAERERRRLTVRADHEFEARVALLLPDHWRPELHSESCARLFRLFYHTLGIALLLLIIAVTLVERA